MGLASGTFKPFTCEDSDDPSTCFDEYERSNQQLNISDCGSSHSDLFVPTELDWFEETYPTLARLPQLIVWLTFGLPAGLFSRLFDGHPFYAFGVECSSP